MNDADDARVAAKRAIANLTAHIDAHKDISQRWTDAGKDLSLNAAQARAANQARGRGWGGILLGRKYTSIARSCVARSNAAIAQQVAAKRAQIESEKREAREKVRQLQEKLSEQKD